MRKGGIGMKSIKRAWRICFFLCLLPLACLAADEGPGKAGGHFPADYRSPAAPPPAGKDIRKYAVDAQSGPQENFGLQPIHDNEMFAVFKADRLEYQSNEGDGLLLWDMKAWAGSDYDKLYLKSEGVWLTDEEAFEEVQAELLYSRNIATFWDLQLGLRHDFEPEPSRSYGAFGFQGLAPYWFELDATAYLSTHGDLSADLELEYDLLLTQRLILQPRLETMVAAHEVAEYGIGQGINHIELGLRLRYEIRREFAPYIGVSWNRKLGETADLAEAEGETTEVVSFVAGVKLWF
ncbi:Copper resistance protein B [uncultured Desulfatiglans sp.]|nr:Copper resistance protein B [uncultured Desulfatiglans sp.]